MHLKASFKRFWFFLCWILRGEQSNKQIARWVVFRTTTLTIANTDITPVGIPLCRKQVRLILHVGWTRVWCCNGKDYLDRLVGFATKVSKAGQIIDMYPWYLKRCRLLYYLIYASCLLANSIVSKLILDREEALRKVIEDVGPIFEERQAKLLELGDQWTDRPVRLVHYDR